MHSPLQKIEQGILRYYNLTFIIFFLGGGRVRQPYPNFRRLLKFRVEAGDTKLKEHITKAAKNATYWSADIQNQIIESCGDEIRDTIITRIKKSGFYVIMVDETTDISSTEQLICLFEIL